MRGQACIYRPDKILYFSTGSPRDTRSPATSAKRLQRKYPDA
jgi:hypothetical protein